MKSQQEPAPQTDGYVDPPAVDVPAPAPGDPTPEAEDLPGISPEQMAKLVAAMTPKPPEKLTSLDQLTGRLQQPIHLDIDLNDGGPVLSIEGRRLMRGMLLRVREHMERHIPPMKRDAATGQEYPDYEDPTYRKQVVEDEKRGKSLAVWLAFPVLRGGLPEDLDVDQVVDILDQKLTAVIVEAAWQRLSESERVVGRAVGFTSSGGSLPS